MFFLSFRFLFFCCRISKYRDVDKLLKVEFKFIEVYSYKTFKSRSMYNINIHRQGIHILDIQRTSFRQNKSSKRNQTIQDRKSIGLSSYRITHNSLTLWYPYLLKEFPPLLRWSIVYRLLVRRIMRAITMNAFSRNILHGPRRRRCHHAELLCQQIWTL